MRVIREGAGAAPADGVDGGAKEQSFMGTGWMVRTPLGRNAADAFSLIALALALPSVAAAAVAAFAAKPIFNAYDARERARTCEWREWRRIDERRTARLGAALAARCARRTHG